MPGRAVTERLRVVNIIVVKPTTAKRLERMTSVDCLPSVDCFDVGSSQTECKRLKARMVDIVRTGEKHSLRYYNEDLSQIPHRNHQIEQQAFAETVLPQLECFAIARNTFASYYRMPLPHPLSTGP